MKKNPPSTVSSMETFGIRTALLTILLSLVIVFVFIQEPPSSQEKEQFFSLLRRAKSSVTSLSDSLFVPYSRSSDQVHESIQPTDTMVSQNIIFDQSYTPSPSFIPEASSFSQPHFDPISPQLSIVRPSAETVTGVVPILINVLDTGVASVEVSIADVFFQKDTSAPYEFMWDSPAAPNGMYRIFAKTYDLAGNSAEASLYVKVDNDHNAPSVSLADPPQESFVYGKSVSITSVASDDRGVERVEFYIDGKLLQTDRSSPYTVSWDSYTLANGKYALSAKAFDAAGNSLMSAVHMVKVVNPAQ